MGLTRQYLRYVASAVFGLIGSQKGNIVFVTLRGEKGRYVAVPACEHVFIWDLRKGEKVCEKSPRLILIYGYLRVEAEVGELCFVMHRFFFFNVCASRNFFFLWVDSEVSHSIVLFYTIF